MIPGWSDIKPADDLAQGERFLGRAYSALTILVIDDQVSGRMLLEELLFQIEPNAEIRGFSNPLEAIEFARANPVDLVVTDYKMPGIDGVETIRRLRQISHLTEIPVICVTVVDEQDVTLKALMAGATDFLSRPLDHLEAAARFKSSLTIRRHQINSQNYAKALEYRIEKATREARLSEMESMLGLAKVAEKRDSITGQHLVRIGKYAALLARECGWSSHEQQVLELAAPLHDIGKIAIPDTILQASRKLTSDEWEIMKTHSEQGYEMLKNSSSRYMKVAAEIARGHHERYDGTGYPHRQSGDRIPIESRIVAIVDVYDALTSERSYKRAWTQQEATDYMLSEQGKHFDPELIRRFFSCAEELRLLQKTFSDSPPC
ncbi:MAG: response regulator [Proteobacteria bacterium]|nr:response regulator [Pseudomonadota bacterium]